MFRTENTHPEHVYAELNYLLFQGLRPIVSSTPNNAGERLSEKLAATRVRIHDARRLASAPLLDRNGFELRAEPSAVANFADDAQVRALYYPEVEALLQRATGAEKVVIFDHTVRLDAERREAGTQEPVRVVHNDQSFVSGPRRVRDHLPSEEAERRLRGRFAIVNVWRPIGAPVQSAPLALCDYPTIAPDDIVPTSFVNGDRVGEVCMFKPNPDHRWFYFPQMRPEEALLIKIYDSREDGTARLSAHSAFDDPTTPPDAPRRNSIEVRTLVFWPA